jgi:hypothetical protein
MYSVISKPKRQSLHAGLVHFMVVSSVRGGVDEQLHRVTSNIRAATGRMVAHAAHLAALCQK